MANSHIRSATRTFPVRILRRWRTTEHEKFKLSISPSLDKQGCVVRGVSRLIRAPVKQFLLANQIMGTRSLATEIDHRARHCVRYTVRRLNKSR
jgi:hypothetical protein